MNLTPEKEQKHIITIHYTNTETGVTYDYKGEFIDIGAAVEQLKDLIETLEDGI